MVERSSCLGDISQRRSIFKPGTTLRLEEGAVIKGSDNIGLSAYSISNGGRSIYYHAALINAYHVDGFEINGPGTINGNGYKFWVQFWDNVERAREENRSWTNLEVPARALFSVGVRQRPA